MTDERDNKPSASSLDYDIRCPGRRKMCEGISQETGAAAVRGTRIHEALEGKEVDLSDSDQATANIIAFFEAEQVEEHGFEGAEIVREKRLWLLDDNLIPVFSGKPDCVHKLGNRIMNVNYKTGFGFSCPIEKNWQVTAESVLLFEEHPDVDEIVSVLIHPHHPDSVTEKIKLGRKWASVKKQTILDYCSKWETSDERTPNPVSCLYCPAKAKCVERLSWIETVLKKADLNTMTPKERGARLADLDVVSKQIDADKELCKELLKADTEAVEGWKLVTSSTRTVTEPFQALETARSKWGDCVNEAVSISLTGIEKAVSKKHAMKKTEANEAVYLALKKFIVSKEKSPSLKRTAE